MTPSQKQFLEELLISIAHSHPNETPEDHIRRFSKQAAAYPDLRKAVARLWAEENYDTELERAGLLTRPSRNCSSNGSSTA
jgi:hypothetical protein